MRSTLNLLRLASFTVLIAGCSFDDDEALADCESTPDSMATRPPATSSSSQSAFTGELLPVFFVSDVGASVVFYKDVLGFEFHHYWDYEANEPVVQWNGQQPPMYARLSAADQVFALHRARAGYEQRVGGMIHYFRVENVDAHYRLVRERGGEPSELIDRPWMRMFSIIDPDGHKLFFQTPSQSWLDRDFD